ncbi:MAG: hypothetical protein ACTIJ6_09275 [Leucobacter sp.]
MSAPENNLVEVEFLALHEHGERFTGRRGIEVAFPERLVAIWADDGPSTLGGVMTLERFFVEAAEYLGEPDDEWLRPLLHRLRIGDNPTLLRDEAIAAYRSVHGADPQIKHWKLEQSMLDRA